jgi:MFS family permease
LKANLQCAATILGSSMVFIDGTVVNVALPALQSALHATLADVQWVVESYALFLATLLLMGGSLGDLFGRRKIFAAGVVLFSVASAWCGLAPNVGELIVARGLQGIGGALLAISGVKGAWKWFLHVSNYPQDALYWRDCYFASSTLLNRARAERRFAGQFPKTHYLLGFREGRTAH